MRISELEKRLIKEHECDQRALDLQAEKNKIELLHLNDKVIVNNSRIHTLENYRSNIDGRVWGASLIVGSVVTGISLLLKFIK